MGLPTELRLIIYQFALQDIIDSILYDPNFRRGVIRYEYALRGHFHRNQEAHPPTHLRLGGLALPLVNRTMRKESLDVYGPLVQKHKKILYDHFIGLQNLEPSL